VFRVVPVWQEHRVQVARLDNLERPEQLVCPVQQVLPDTLVHKEVQDHRVQLGRPVRPDCLVVSEIRDNPDQPDSRGVLVLPDFPDRRETPDLLDILELRDYPDQVE
jgi:hypothetical protein